MLTSGQWKYLEKTRTTLQNLLVISLHFYSTKPLNYGFYSFCGLFVDFLGWGKPSFPCQLLKTFPCNADQWEGTRNCSNQWESFTTSYDFTAVLGKLCNWGNLYLFTTGPFGVNTFKLLLMLPSLDPNLVRGEGVGWRGNGELLHLPLELLRSYLK